MPHRQKLVALARRARKTAHNIVRYLFNHLPAPVKNLSIWAKIRRHKKRAAIIAAAGSIGLIGLFFIFGFFMPGNVVFSFSQPTCAFAPQVLPNLTSDGGDDRFAASAQPAISLFGYPLVSLKSCVSPLDPPSADSQAHVTLAPLGNPLLKKKITVAVANTPSAAPDFDSSKEVAATSTLAFSLNMQDAVHTYQLTSGQADSNCQADGQKLSCNLAPLDLKQGQSYALKLEQHFADTAVKTMAESSVTTLDPVIITKSSIKPGATVYNIPKSITLKTNKKLVSTEPARLVQTDTDEHISDITTEITDDGLIIKLSRPLPRKSNFELSISGLAAEDGSLQAEQYLLAFKTSGGPKVTSVSVGTSRVSIMADPVLKFDAGLEKDQNLAKFVSLEHGGRIVPASLRLDGSHLTIRSTARLNRCADYTIRVKTGLVNQYGVEDGEAWQYNFRTLCQQVFSIGSSVEGRSITAYRFGSGASKIVFVGGMHGNENSSVATLRAWINYLENHAREIPARRSIIVIPNANPDGYARGSRTNANDVDINRNFPANDWQSSVEMPGGVTAPTGGGKSPGDQPETKALMSYINANRPRFVLTYHAVARVVISNDAGDSSSLGRSYASASGYRFTTDAGSDAEFGYATTGEFEDWLADKKGIPAILIELGYMYSSEFTTHRSALMNLVKLP